ncbi:hypothetical protein ACLKA7_014962 [Drosophila subpalustris]
MVIDLALNWLSSHRSSLRLVFDVVLLGGLLVVGKNFRRIWGPPTQRGFFCDDESLMYPYQENTVTPTMLHWISLHLPLAALVVLESYRCWKRTGAASHSRWERFWPVYNTLRWFLFGHVAEQLIKDMGKQLIGRLRPHFFEVCRPVFDDGTTCTDSGPGQSLVYHTAYTCQPDLSGATEAMLRDVRVSFPSGHSAMAFYGLVFLALHLQRVRRPKPSTLLRPLCQLLLVALASFVGLSRVTDYKHHWSDVVAGSLLGASIALAVVRGAEQEQRLQLQANAKGPQTAATSAVVAKRDEELAKATDAEQLPHDLYLVTCHSSN